MSISVEDFGRILRETAETFSAEAVEEIENGIMDTAKEVRKILATDLSPKRWKKYRTKFTVSKSTKTENGTYVVAIWNRYSHIIHLLELGTCNADGTQRTRPQPHMQPAKEIAEKKIDELMRKYNGT